MSILGTIIDAVTPAASGAGEVDAIDLLKQDHDDVDKLFKEYDELVDGKAEGDRRALSTRICGMIAVHAIIEEEIFYPAARRAGVDLAMLDEATVEHASAKELIAHIGASKASEALYDARVKVLGEYIRHHVKEEEGELFPACQKTEMDMKRLGAALAARKDDLMQKLERR